MKKLLPDFISDKFVMGKEKGNFKAGVMFIDISGFTSMTENLMHNGKEGAEILSDLINTIFSPAITEIYDKGGFISTFAGDAFTAIFQYKISNPVNILISAQKIRKIFSESEIQHTKFGEFDLSVKIGLSYGDVQWGIIKSAEYNTYFFKGNTLRKCYSIQKYVNKNEIIFDQSILLKISNQQRNNLHHDEISSDLFKLLSINYVEYHVKKYKKDISQIQKKFIPDSIIKLQIKGEFRYICSCFIFFRDRKGWKQIVSKIIKLSNEHKAYFNKIDFSDKGGYVLVIFGAPISTERIYYSAAEFTLKVKSLYRDNVRIGLTAGTAFTGFIGSDIREEYTALGMVVNKAVRIANKTEWGKILIDENIQKKFERYFVLKSMGSIKLKGFSTDIPCYELLNFSSKDYQYFNRKFFVGRYRELQNLEKMLKEVQQKSKAQIIHIEGEAGIGKSRLLHEFRDKLDIEKYDWLYIPCDEIIRTSFKPFVYFLSEYFKQRENGEKVENLISFDQKIDEFVKSDINETFKIELIRSKSFLAALLGFFDKESLYEKLDAQGKFDNTLIALKNIILLKCSRKPLILEIDDAHWIDSDSVSFLKFLLQDNPEIPLLILICSRITNENKLSIALSQISEIRVPIRKFSKIFTKKFVREIFNCNIIPIKTHNLIYNITEGNPFYIEQFAMFLKENNIIDTSYNLKISKVDIPQSISSIIIARIDKLSYELKEVIETASVLGREFIVEILSAMLKKFPIKKYLIDGENEAIWNSINEIKYIFKHAILRETVYEMQLKSRLRKLHKLAGDTIVELFSDDISKYYGELSYHFERADDQDKAIDYLKKAAKFSKNNYRNNDAIYYYRRLLSYLEKNILIDEIFTEKIGIKTLKTLKKAIFIRLDMRHVLSQIGDWNEALRFAQETIKIARKAADQELLATASLDLAKQFHESADFDKSLELCEKALKLINDSSESEIYIQILNTQGRNYLDSGEYDKAMNKFKEVLNISEKNNDSEMVSIVQTNIGLIYSSWGELDNSIKYLKNSLIVARDLNDLVGVAKILNDIGTVYEQFHDFVNARLVFEESIKTCKEIGYKRGLAIAYGNLGVIFRKEGNQVKALEYYNLKLQISLELGDKKGLAIVYGTLGNLFLDKGDLEKAMLYQKRSLKMAEETSDQSTITVTLGNIGEIYKNRKEFTKALNYFDKAIRIDKEIRFNHHLSYVFAQKINTLLDMERFSDAKQLISEAKKMATQIEDQLSYFFLNLDECKINFELSENIEGKRHQLEELSSMLKSEKDTYKLALIHYEITLLSAKIDDLDPALLREAEELCQKLYESNPSDEHKNMIEELKKIKLIK